MQGRSVRFDVLMTESAEHDLESIYDYISEYDCPANADYVLDQLTSVLENLAHFPERGSHPKELAALGIKEYRQAMFKPYRVIYRIINTQVVIYVIADGRRDMQSLLSRRLLGA
ncbi:MAG TPA: type II toxin-antitoxin system RelE/ParE family toxin [Paraburkholderia sp.]|jgi:toxin ParE1/3/4|uniref:type II toxin-antitoxin system RelE/ParE family toxin n=1 Tax=Paraburkholderia sp. TaxID=1926495 RepID=UPI002DE2257D|nr:type II toxin-antitoxin system RelE/ParE family toxin [Paraburkholderia sp.]